MKIKTTLRYQFVPTGEGMFGFFISERKMSSVDKNEEELEPSLTAGKNSMVRAPWKVLR